MDRITRKTESRENYVNKYYIVEEEIGISNRHLNVISTEIEGTEFRGYGKPIDKLGKLEDLEEQIGCPLEVVVKAFQKYIGWTTDCDFGYDNIPDEFEKYQNDKKFMNLKYNEGLMYIAIQETLEDIELEKIKG